jgi:hypothetical protein
MPEKDTFSGQIIEVRRFDIGIAHATQRLGSKLVRND